MAHHGIPRPTTTQARPYEPAQSPHPTPAAVLLQKLDAAGNLTCGFVDGELGPSPVTCDNALQTCVVDETAAVAGCCGTTSIDQSSDYFVDCEFYSVCIDYSDSNILTHLSGAATSVVNSETAAMYGASVAASPPVQHALSCSAVSPFCAAYPFTYDELTYSILGCHRTSGDFSLRLLSNLPTYRQLPDIVARSLTSSSPIPETSNPQHSATLSDAEKTGISIGVPLFLVVVVAVAILCFRYRRGRLKPGGPMKHKERASFRGPPSPNPHDLPPGSLEDPTTFPSDLIELTTFSPHQIRPPTKHPPPSYSAQGELSREERRVKYLSSAKNRTFLTFLSSYGPGGVSLRELIMLVTLRQGEMESQNHWLADGEVGTFEEVIDEIVFTRQDWVFGRFLRSGVVDRSAIESFQELLESLDLIDVRYPEGTQSDEASQYWHTDERIWIIRGSESSEPSAPIDDFSVLRGLLGLLIGMPDKDVFAVAQRQREVYYYHAHLLIRRVIRSQRILEKHRLLLMQAVFVTLQLLTHRYQIGDSLLLDFVREYSVRYLHLNMNVMLLWAELKEKAFREDYDGLCTIRDRALHLVNELQSQAAPRLNGFLGFVLVDLMKNAKASHFEDIVGDAVKAGTKWADSAHQMDTSIEKTALCEILATFDVHARNEIIQKDHYVSYEYYLLYGYHLSRAGFLVQGDQFLARGLKNHKSIHLWSYQMERVSNALRLGRQNEAVQMLKSIRELALHNRNKGPFSIRWKNSGECAANFVLLYLYEADYSASAGRLDDACAKLKSGISITSSVYDAYIRILRVTLEMRLLEILMRQGSLEEALPVALNLASEILDERTSSTLAPDVVYGIAQQLLDLSNTLFSAGNAAASMALLKSITSIGALVPGELSKELKLYVEQRMAKARHFSGTIELSGHDPNPSTLDTGIEDPKSLVQTNPSYDPTIPTAKEATFHNPDNDTEARYIIDRVEKANPTMEDIDILPEEDFRDPGSSFQVSARPTALMNASLDPPSSSKNWKTGIEDPITQVQTDPGYEPTVPKREETTVLTKASLDPHSSYRIPPKLPNSTNLQILAKKSRERYRPPLSKAFQSKMYASTLGKLQRAPRPPSTEPDKSTSASGEKAMQREELPSRIEVKPSAMVPGVP